MVYSFVYDTLYFVQISIELQFRCMYYYVTYTGLSIIQISTYGKRNSSLQEKNIRGRIWRQVWTCFVWYYNSDWSFLKVTSPLQFISFDETLQLKNARGYTLQCSHYLPFSVPEDISLPCVVYCHGNRYSVFCAHWYCFSVESLFFSVSMFHVRIYVQLCSGCRADANEAAVILLPSNITVFTLDFSGSGLSDGDHVSLGWHEVSFFFSFTYYITSFVNGQFNTFINWHA